MQRKSTTSGDLATGLATAAQATTGGEGGQAPAERAAPPAHSTVENFEQRRLFPVVEAQLPERLGLSRDLIRTLREEILQKGRHWVKAHRDILLTEEAVTLLLEAHARIKTPAPFPTPPPPLNVAPDEACACPATVKNAPPIHEMRVVRQVPVNPKLIMAALPQDPANTYYVRVQSSANYRPGMVIYANRVSATLFAIHGRAPHYPGERLYRDE